MAIVIREKISWWSKLKQSFFGFLMAFVLVFVALGLLVWNEHRTLKNYKGLRAAASAVVAIDANALDSSRDGALVHVQGQVVSRESVRDADFGIEAPALLLRRSVEMYQWREKKETKDQQKLGGGTERVTTYSYEQRWSDEPIDSSRFQDTRHRNPTDMPWRSQRFAVSDARLGAFRAEETILNALASSPLQLAEAGSYPSGFRRMDGQTLYRGTDPVRPVVGDVRVRFSAVPSQMASVVAKAQGERLLAWDSPAGTSVFLAQAGSHTAAAMIDSAQARNTGLGWALRGAGFGLMWLAFSMMFAPLATVAAVLPPLGKLVGKLSGMVAFVLAAVLSLLTIVAAWVFVRPVWAVSLVLAIVAVIALWARYGARKSAPAMSQAASMPPPMPPPPPR